MLLVAQEMHRDLGVCAGNQGQRPATITKDVPSACHHSEDGRGFRSSGVRSQRPTCMFIATSQTLDRDLVTRDHTEKHCHLSSIKVSAS